MTGIVIIGAGECGVRAAFALREHGHEGDILLIGAENTLPYERPPLSKGDAGEPKVIRPKDAYAEARIDLRLGATAVSVDREARTVRLTDDTAVGYDTLLIATGSRARLFPGMEACLTLRTDADARSIAAKFRDGSRIGLIGGGFIGLELAATARTAGADVTVVEAAPRILGRAVPEEIAAFVHARHDMAGVEIIAGSDVSGADATTIRFADGSDRSFDAVIAGVGAVPNTGLAEAAGLAVDNGIVVDSAFRTSDPDIFAAGDCCNFEWRGKRVRLESWRAAQDQGAFVAAAMLGANETYTRVPWFWSDQYDITLQVAGLFDLAGDIHRRPSSDDVCLVFQCDPGGRLAAAAGIGPGNAAAKDIRILEKLVERRTPVNVAAMADPSFNLKKLLKAS